jgi:hypothetical protein
VRREQLVPYLRRQLTAHLRLFFQRGVADWIENEELRFVPYAEAVTYPRPAVLLPVDIDPPSVPTSSYSVPFNGTTLTLWNPLPQPPRHHWHAWPNERAPLWYVGKSGALMPAWNIVGNLLDGLTFTEELRCPVRDRHGRFPSAMSPRMNANVLRVPAFNEAAAAIVSGLLGLKQLRRPDARLDGLVQPPGLLLSHDCDILMGNDATTQMIRLIRVVSPMLKARLPKLSNLYWFMENAIFPGRYYLENLVGMIELERQYGFRSVFYFLSGTAGRFGARDSRRALLEAIRLIPDDWEIGIHYNYDTFLDADRFSVQHRELERLSGRSIKAGRAHYLRFDTSRSFRFLEHQGILVDESVGYPDFTGYRAGIAGAFKPVDYENGQETDVLEVPLVYMDSTQAKDCQSAPDAAFDKTIRHLSRIGGLISLLIHSGQFFNPEYPESNGLYADNLWTAYQHGARAYTPSELYAAFSG